MSISYRQLHELRRKIATHQQRKGRLTVVLADRGGSRCRPGSGTADLADAAAGWTDRIDIVAADCPSQMWEVPGAGTISTPAALLIRPDGHVAWASDRDPDLVALHEALDTWCGPASSQL